MLTEIPSAKVEAVVLVKGANITSAIYGELLENGMPVAFVDAAGRFAGRLESVAHHNIERQALQFERYNDGEFCLAMAKKIISGKLNNSQVVLRRYNRNIFNARVKEIISMLDAYEPEISASQNLTQLGGYEGASSKLYFEGLSHMVCDEFRFQGRSKRPPKDPFNSLLSFGYTLLVNEIYTSVTNKGLNPYIGFMHRLRNGHPALASDLMEEWRSLIVDSMVMNLVNGGTYKAEDFTLDSKTGGVYLNREDSKKFAGRFETKLLTTNKYINDINSPMTFRETAQYQINLLVRAIEERNPDLYNSVMIR